MALQNLFIRGVFSLEHKKKFLGKLSFLCGLLFCLLFEFSSTTCYARTTLTDREAQIIYNYLFSTEYNEYINNSQYFNGILLNTDPRLRFTTNSYKSFMNSFNANNTIDIDYNSTFILALFDSTDNRVMIVCANANMGKIDNLPHLYLEFRDWDATRLGDIKFINDKGDTVTTNYDIFNFYLLDDGSLTFNSIEHEDASYISGYPKILLDNWNSQYRNSDIIENLPGLFTFSSTNSIYINSNGLNIINPTPKLLKSIFDLIPSEPSGDVSPSGDDGGGGTITPSGDNGGSTTTPDYTNQLNDINSNISNSTIAITNQISGDTQKITSSIDNLNNTLTEQPNLNNANITSGDIERRFRF